VGALTVDRDAWDDARRALRDDELPFTPYLLPRIERLAVAGRLAGAGWSQTMIATAFGVSTTTAQRWLNGDWQPDWAKLGENGSRPAVRYGRHRSRNPQRRRPAAEPEPEAIATETNAEPWPDDEPEPDGPWNDPEPDDDEAEELPPKPGPRAKRAVSSTLSLGQIAANLAAYQAARSGALANAPGGPQGAPQAASAAVVPPAPPLRHPVPPAAPRRAQPASGVPARAVDAEVVASCGHALYVPPARAARGSVVTCTQCGQRGQVQRLTGRFTLG
jgi:hypothetical protein